MTTAFRTADDEGLGPADVHATVVSDDQNSVNGARSLAAWTLPGGARRAADRGLREQESFLRTIIGDTEAIIGASVTHVHEVPEPADPGDVD